MDNKTNYEVWNKLYRFLLKDVKDFNSYILSFVSILIILLAGFVSYFVTSDSSFAWFSQTIRSNNNINVKVSLSGGSNSESAVNFLMKKVGYSGLEVITHEADSTLQIGNISDITEYRYRGSDEVVTNNYVYFNCSDINNQTSQTCELYRIIGVFPVDDGTGKIENRVKLVKVASYGNYYWDENVNNWQVSSLNDLFNNAYYNSINTKYQYLIGNAKYYLGGSEGTILYTSAMYEYERKISGSVYSGNPVNWTGKIALMYVSDYGYAANDACTQVTLLSNYNVCSNYNWLHFEYEWLLAQDSSCDFAAFYSYSSVNLELVNSSLFAVRPVFYLTADAMFNDIGDGSFDNPYQLMEK